jgi:hypothetical protein
VYDRTFDTFAVSNSRRGAFGAESGGGVQSPICFRIPLTISLAREPERAIDRDRGMFNNASYVCSTLKSGITSGRVKV